MLTIYGVYRSRASRPLWLLGEIGMAFRHVPVIQSYRLADPAAADAPLHTDSPEFAAINPMRQVPAMEDGGTVLTESMAITLYIAQAHGLGLGPQGLGEDGEMTNWAFFAATALEPAALAIMQAPEGDDAARDAAAARLARPLARLEGHLGANEWLVGGRFTAADICVAECLRYAQGHGALMAAHPAATAWLARCHARPAFAAMWAARMAEPA